MIMMLFVEPGFQPMGVADSDVVEPEGIRHIHDSHLYDARITAVGPSPRLKKLLIHSSVQTHFRNSLNGVH